MLYQQLKGALDLFITCVKNLRCLPCYWCSEAPWKYVENSNNVREKLCSDYTCIDHFVIEKNWNNWKDCSKVVEVHVAETASLENCLQYSFVLNLILNLIIICKYLYLPQNFFYNWNNGNFQERLGAITSKSFAEYYNITCNADDNRDCCRLFGSVIVFKSLKLWKISVNSSYSLIRSHLISVFIFSFRSFLNRSVVTIITLKCSFQAARNLKSDGKFLRV